MTKPYVFNSLSLNRKANERKDIRWLNEQRNTSTSEVIFIWRANFLFSEQKLFVISYQLFRQLNLEDIVNEVLFLGTKDYDHGQALFVADVSQIDDENQLNSCLAQAVSVISLRASLAFVNGVQASELAYASALTHWFNSHQFCGYCGSENNIVNGGQSLLCNHSECGKSHFPRTDPVVIMLVEYKPEHGAAMCLLANHTRSPTNVYSTLAGFVDTAESLEQAVIREVYEETGVNVNDVRYIASQPWPFPSSLMIGFRAVTKNTTIQIDDDEIANAAWFTAQQVREFDNWGDEGDNLQLPRKESISRYLIEQWLEEQL